LVGVAALSAWGLYRFNQILAGLPSQGGGDSLLARVAAEGARYKLAFSMQYGEIFGITAIVCVVGALLGLLIAGKGTHADDPDELHPDEASTKVLSKPADQATVQIPRPEPRGRHAR
jgi:MFS transporter, DHA2 family, triacylglyceride efflux pump